MKNTLAGAFVIMVAIAARSDIAWAEERAAGVVRVVGSLGASTTSEGTPGGTAGTGFEYEGERVAARLRVNVGIASFGVRSFYLLREDPRIYANMILQSDTRGASIAADGTYLFHPRVPAGDLRIGLGATFRASLPLVTWSSENYVRDPTTVGGEFVTRSGDIATLALLAGGALSWSIPALRELPIHLGIAAGFSMRGIVGNLDDELLVWTLHTASRVFLGGEVRLKLGLGDVHGFAALPFLWNAAWDGAVTGLTGPRFVFGVEVTGNIFEKPITASSASPKPLDETPPPPPGRIVRRTAPIPRLDL